MGEFDNAIKAGKSAKSSPVQADVDNLLESIDLDEVRLTENKRYQSIVADCQKLHADLLEYERTGKLGNYVENPSLIGDYLGKLRLNANQLFAFMNIYIDILSDLEREYADKRQKIYIETYNAPKGSASGAEKHARELTRTDEVKILNVKNNLQQIKNEYERFNGICLYLQSRMKEFASERFMG